MRLRRDRGGLGLTPSELSNVSYVGQTVRHRREPKPRATTEQRITLEARAYRASRALDQRIREGDEALRELLATQYGIDSATSFFDLGVGLETNDEGRDFLVAFTRDSEGRIAWLQRREVSDGRLVGDWLSARNPDKGTETETRYDAVGAFGTWRGTGPLLVAEGASDGLTLAALGRYDVLAVRGASMAEQIDDARDLLLGRDVVVLADNDDAGERMTRAVIDRIGPYANSTSYVRWANDAKGYDVRDFRSEAPDAFPSRLARLVTGAERVYRKGADSFETDQYVGRGDEGVAAAIRDYVRHLGYDLAHTKERGWLFYDRTRWVPDSEGTIRHLAATLGREYAAQVTQRITERASELAAGSPKALARAHGQAAAEFEPHQKLAAKLMATHGVSAALAHLSGHPTVAASISEFDADPDVLAVANGVVELRTGKLRPMRAADRITRRLSVAYRPDAKAPKFEKFLRDVFVDPSMETDEELVAYVKRLIGYGITGHASEQKLFLLHGVTGANGKSQLLEIISSVFREITQVASFRTFESSPDAGVYSDLAQMQGARFVIASEGSGKGLSEEIVKSITGDRQIRAKFMRQDFFSFNVQFTLLLATNEMPEVSNKNPIWRRLRVIEFNRTFHESEQIKDIGVKIADEEAEGILAMAVAEAVKWYAEGLPDCAAVDHSTAEARDELDPLNLFLRLNVHESEDGKSGTVLLLDLWHRWTRWCDALRLNLGNAPDGFPETQRALKKLLVERWGKPANRTVNGRKTDMYPIRWTGRRLIAPEAVVAAFGAMRMEALGAADYIDAGEITLDLGQDPGVVKYSGKLRGVEPVDPFGSSQANAA